MARTLAASSTQSFRTAQYTPERVLREKGLTGRASPEQLAAASAPFDDVNKGYLSEVELRKGADALLGTGLPSRTEGFRFASRTLGEVQRAVPKPNSIVRFTPTEILMAAAAWDEGNKYLNKKELMAGAYALQMRAMRGELSTDDVEAIRRITGAKGPGPTAVTPTGLGEVEGLSAAEARALFAEHMPGASVDDLMDAADEVIDNREGTRNSQFWFSVEPADHGTLDVQLSTSFDYEGAEFSHYTSFSVEPTGDFSITDAGAD